MGGSDRASGKERAGEGAKGRGERTGSGGERRGGRGMMQGCGMNLKSMAADARQAFFRSEFSSESAVALRETLTE